MRGRGRVQIWNDTGGYKYVSTWEDTDIWVHGRMQMYENIGGYRYVSTWEDTDVQGHGVISICNISSW